MRSVIRFALACWLALGASSQLFASADEAFVETLLLRLEEEGQNGAYQWLQSVQAEHRDTPLYYDWLSRFAMDKGDYQRAIPALERLILLEPRHMGARLDLVLALQLEGRSIDARQALQALHGLLPDRTQLPDQAQRQLAELDKLLQPDAAAEPNRFSALVSAGLGHDSNANRGSDDKTLKVNLPGGLPIELVLAPESIKTADEFAEVGLYLEYGKRGTGCRFDDCRQWLAGAMTRRYANLDEYDQRHLYLGTRKSFAGRYQREYSLMVQNLVSSKLEFNRVDEQNILGFEYRQLLPGLPRLGGVVKADLIDEKANDNPVSTMGTVGVNGSLAFGFNPDFRKSGRRLLWEAAGSWHHRPDYFAGDTRRLWLAVNYPLLVAEEWYFNVGVTYRWRNDEEPFSQGFFGDTVRTDKEWLLSAQAQRSLGSWLLSSRLHYEKTGSNIPLFDVNRLQWTLSVAYQVW